MNRSSKDFKIEEIKAILGRWNLPTQGKKSEFIARLHKADPSGDQTTEMVSVEDRVRTDEEGAATLAVKNEATFWRFNTEVQVKELQAMQQQLLEMMGKMNRGTEHQLNYYGTNSRGTRKEDKDGALML